MRPSFPLQFHNTGPRPYGRGPVALCLGAPGCGRGLLFMAAVARRRGRRQGGGIPPRWRRGRRSGRGARGRVRGPARRRPGCAAGPPCLPAPAPRRRPAALAQHGAVQHGRVHADEAPVPDRAAVQDGPVPDADAAAERDVKLRAGVQHGVVLHVGVGADRDAAGVGAQHRAVPHAGARAKAHRPRQHRARRHERRGGGVRRVAADGQAGHGKVSFRIKIVGVKNGLPRLTPGRRRSGPAGRRAGRRRRAGRGAGGPGGAEAGADAERRAAHAGHGAQRAHRHCDERRFGAAGGGQGRGFQQAGGVRRGGGHHGQLGNVRPGVGHGGQGVGHGLGRGRAVEMMFAEHGRGPGLVGRGQ